MIIKALKLTPMLKLAQGVPQLVSIFKVHPDVAQETFNLIQSLTDKDKKFIIKWVKNNPPQNQEGITLLNNEIQRQTGYSAQAEVKKQEDLGVSPEILEQIKKITPIEKFQQWIIKGFKNKTIAETDLLGLKGQLRRFKKLIDREELTEEEKNIDRYSSSADINELLSKYLNSGIVESLPPASLGYEVLEDTVANGQSLKLLKVTTPEAMAAISNMITPQANWCVAKGSFTIYPNPVYYCFLIKGSPEILVHPESGQLKNIHDRPISNALHAKIIAPYVEKYGLTDANKMVSPYRTNTMYGSIDQDNYKKTLKKIEEIESKSDNIEEMGKLIDIDPQDFSLMPEKAKVNLLDKLANKINSIDIYTFNQIDLELLYNYLDLKKDPRIKELNNKVTTWLKSDPSNFIFYHGRIPDFLKNEETSKEYKKIVDEHLKDLSKGFIPASKVEKWFKEKIDERSATGKELPKEWVSAIAKSIEDHGKVAAAAHDWVKKQFEAGSPLPEIEQAAIKRLLYEGDISAIKKLPIPAEWVMKSKEKIFKNPEIWQDKIVSQTVEKGFPPKLFTGWAIKDLNTNAGKSILFPAVKEWIVKNGVPAPFAEKWCINQLASSPDDALVSAICECLLENGQLPEFAFNWCKQEFTKDEPNKVLIDGFIACGSKYRKIPNMAHEWFKKNMKRLLAEKQQREQSVPPIATPPATPVTTPPVVPETTNTNEVPVTTSATLKQIMSFASFFNHNVIRKLP